MPWETEAEEPQVMYPRSDTRSITVTLSSANYRFDIAETIDEAGVVRSRFAVGEKLRLHFKMTNKGDVKSDCHLKITDTDTGAVVFETTYSGVDPNKFIDGRSGPLTMPDRNWRWLVAISP